ncbi:hypothetical protein RM844_11705 [Streptomyces sp. DSM 44915]|uniref:Uncharacterized protein n=1 Tax=Streptomyces chisholmiae TaxID=3075540 RepID=A0ABU2JPP5_9ACTN|nr:hypothetical protein [Streptomyces sp. DSM 44915]MDT0266956.1 hypothetical protein [Streptomyces sp. DSM 44915]
MEALAASAIAVLGTLLGATVNHLFQWRNTERAQLLARQERLRAERLDALAGYASSLTDYRRALIHRWCCLHDERPPGDPTEARMASYERLNEARHALFRCQLLFHDCPKLIARAQEVMARVAEIHDAGDDPERLDELRHSTRELIDGLVGHAARELTEAS